MPGKTQKQQIADVYQAVVGVDGNPDANGMIGDIKEKKTHLARLSG